MSTKVFGIGLNKTGTRSLAFAMRILGLRTFHKGDAATNELVLQAAAEDKPLLSRIGDNYDAYLDVDALAHRFRMLDAQYPSSKFILTTRALSEWLDSRERHVRANRERAARGEYSGPWLTIDREGWVRAREKHHRDVHNYFEAASERLLVMDLGAGDGWEILAPFLERPVPPIAFPWENRSGAGTYRNNGLTHSHRRLARLARARLTTYARGLRK